MASIELARELATVRSALAADGDVPAAVARLAVIAAEAVAAAGPARVRRLTRDHRLALEGLAAHRQQAGAAEAARCWFGKSAEDGLPWMFCLDQAFATEVLAALDDLIARP